MKSFFSAIILSSFLHLAAPIGAAQSASPLPKPIEGKEIQALAHAIASHMDDGLQLKDLVSISKEIDIFLSSHLNLTIAQKKEVITKTLFHVIDYTDTPYLPDAIFDPVLKSLIPSLVAVLFPDSKGSSILQPVLIDASAANVEELVAHLADEAEKGLTAATLPSFILQVIHVTDTFFTLNHDEKRSLAKTIIDKIIDKTNTPFLPDTMFDPMFKSLAHEVIDFIMKKGKV